MGNTQGLENSTKLSSNINIKDDSPMPLRDELEERFAQLVVSCIYAYGVWSLATNLEYCILMTSNLAIHQVHYYDRYCSAICKDFCTFETLVWIRHKYLGINYIKAIYEPYACLDNKSYL